MEHFTDYLKSQGIIADDAAMVKLYSDALSIAPTDANILIQGDSGTGKDCLAKFIHSHSPRAGFPFVHVNCSAVPEELFESEFFGYEPGAFTGGSPLGHRGLVAEAAGGTLFLDEIGELAPGLQTKLLQIVQEHSVRSIGANEDTSVNIRILAATNRSLPQMIKLGRFRLDLYYRLNVVCFDIPPLSRRRMDIRGLTEHLSAQFCQVYGCRKTFTPQAMDFLMAQEWLGNIRELQNFMEKLYVLEESTVITDRLLRENYRFSSCPPCPPSPKSPGFKPLKQAVAAFEAQYIREVIQNSHDLDEAAMILGVGREWLGRRLKDLE